MRFVGVCTIMAITAVSAWAASANVDKAVSVFAAVGKDAAKLKIFCEMNKTLQAMGDKEDAAAEAKINAQIKQLGAEFEAAWNVGEGMDEHSPDMKILGDAMGALTDKCK